MTALASTTALPLAHLLHWYFMPLYAAPIVLVLYSTVRETIRQRRGSDDPKAGLSTSTKGRPKRAKRK
jgi:hypothetical protein